MVILLLQTFNKYNVDRRLELRKCIENIRCQADSVLFVKNHGATNPILN